MTERIPVTRISRPEMIQSLVDLRERAVLGLRQDILAGGKFQHGSHCDRRSIGGTGHAALGHDDVHRLDRHRFEHRTDEMQTGP